MLQLSTRQRTQDSFATESTSGSDSSAVLWPSTRHKRFFWNRNTPTPPPPPPHTLVQMSGLGFVFSSASSEISGSPPRLGWGCSPFSAAQRLVRGRPPPQQCNYCIGGTSAGVFSRRSPPPPAPAGVHAPDFGLARM